VKIFLVYAGCVAVLVFQSAMLALAVRFGRTKAGAP
jgi:hypothetical protein